MPPGVNSWIYEGKGRAPSLAWSVATEAPLVALEYARGRAICWLRTKVGRCRASIPRDGSRMSPKLVLRCADWHGRHRSRGAVLVDQTRLYWFDERLRFTGSAELPGRTCAVAIESQARYVAVALSDGLVVIHDPNRKVVRHFDGGQPFVRMRFLLDQPAIVGVAEYGLLACHHFEGERIWAEKLFSGVGDMAVTGDGKAVLWLVSRWECNVTVGMEPFGVVPTRRNGQSGGDIVRFQANRGGDDRTTRVLAGHGRRRALARGGPRRSVRVAL